MKDDILTYSGGSSSSTPPTVSPEDSLGSPQNSIQQSPEEQGKSPSAAAVAGSVSYDWYGLPAPMFGTMVPNRVFVGGISPQTTDDDLTKIFQRYGIVRNTKVIMDRAGVSKGYGFVTFETEREARALCDGMANKILDPIIVHDRRLNIAPAVKKQSPIPEFYPSAPPSPAPYTRAAYYLSQGNASQYYYQALPIHIQEPLYHSQDVCHFAPNPMPHHSYYAAPPPAVNGSMYCMPEMYQVQPAQTQSIPYFAPRTHSVLPSFPPSPPQISLANPSIYQIQVPSPIEPSSSNMWQHSPPPCPPCPLFDSMDTPPYFNRFMFTDPID